MRICSLKKSSLNNLICYPWTLVKSVDNTQNRYNLLIILDNCNFLHTHLVLKETVTISRDAFA